MCVTTPFTRPPETYTTSIPPRGEGGGIKGGEEVLGEIGKGGEEVFRGDRGGRGRGDERRSGEIRENNNQTWTCE